RLFPLPDDARLKVDADDGRSWLERHPARRFDAIMVDAFYADSIPFHLFTAEFLAQVREHLKPGGVVVLNTIGATAGPDSQLERAIYRTYRSAFPTVLVHPVVLPGEAPNDVRNVMLVATDAPAPGRDFLLERWNELRREHPTAPDLARPIRDRIDRPLRLAGVPLLTDDYAPTDSLLLLD